MGQRTSAFLARWSPFGPRDAAAPPEDPEHARQHRPAGGAAKDAAPNAPVEHFFGTHFLIGGKRFEVAKPEAFLFGHNADLDLFGAPVKVGSWGGRPEPLQFPYGGLSSTVGVLNALVNIRKDSIKISR